MNIFFVYRSPRQELWNSYINGHSPSTFFYGLPELKQMGHYVEFSDIAFHRYNLLKLLLMPFDKLFSFLLNYPIGFQLHQSICLWFKYRKADIIVTAQDSAGLPLLLLKSIGLINNKIAYISGSLVNAFSKPRSRIILKFIHHLLEHANIIICYSNKEKQILQKYLGKPVKFIPLGVDIQYFTPTLNIVRKDIDILSVGRDSYRDYATLFKAVLNKPWNITVACSPENLKNIEVPSNIKVLYNISPNEIRKLYKRAKLIVIPMKNTNRTQGQISFLEAMAMEKDIIASKVSGLTSVDTIFNYKKATFIQPENSINLSKVIQVYLEKPNKLRLEPIQRYNISSIKAAEVFSKILLKA